MFIIEIQIVMVIVVVQEIIDLLVTNQDILLVLNLKRNSVEMVPVKSLLPQLLPVSQ